MKLVNYGRTMIILFFNWRILYKSFKVGFKQAFKKKKKLKDCIQILQVNFQTSTSAVDSFDFPH